LDQLFGWALVDLLLNKGAATNNTVEITNKREIKALVSVAKAAPVNVPFLTRSLCSDALF
jgi:hypothetical protein